MFFLALVSAGPVVGAVISRLAMPSAGRPLLVLAASALIGGLIALSAAAFAPHGTVLLSCLFGWCLLALALVDLDRLILPDGLNAVAAGLGIIMIWQTRPDAWAPHLIGAAAGYLILLAVELAYRHGRGRDGLGRGDAKLLGVLGLWVGWMQLPDILMIASFAGLIAALVASRLSRARMEKSSAIAFGPWLALAGWISWLAGPLIAAPL